MNDIITTIVKILGAVLGIVVTRYLVPAIKNWEEKNRDEQFMKIIQIFVEAAEQIFPESKSGETKKEYVQKFGGAWIISQEIEPGIKMHYQALLDSFIESAVFNLESPKNPTL